MGFIIVKYILILVVMFGVEFVAFADNFVALQPSTAKLASTLQKEWLPPLTWDFVARANAIFKARVDVDEGDFREDFRDNRFKHIALKINVSEILKDGPIIAPLKEEIRVSRNDFYPPPEVIQYLAGRDCIVMVDYIFVGKYHIIDGKPFGIRLYNSNDELFIHSETEKNKKWLTNFDVYRREYKDDEMDKRVSALIEQMHKSKGARNAVYELYQMGGKAVPAIIRNIDNFKSFKEKKIIVPLDEVKDKMLDDCAKLRFSTVIEALGYVLLNIEDSPIHCGWLNWEATRQEIQEKIDYCRISLMHMEEVN